MSVCVGVRVVCVRAREAEGVRAREVATCVCACVVASVFVIVVFARAVFACVPCVVCARVCVVEREVNSKQPTGRLNSVLRLV